MKGKLIHTHQSTHFKKTNIFLLLLPTVVYAFVIAFYLITSYGLEINQVISSLNNPPNLEIIDETILGESNIDN